MCKISEMNLETAKYYGYEAQSNQLVEECAELIQAVNKYRRVETGLGQPVAEDKKAIARDNLVEEIADVELMLEQIKYLLQIPEDELLAVKTFICSSTYGYWYSRDPDDISTTLSRLVGQVDNMQKVIAGLNRILQEVQDEQKES